MNAPDHVVRLRRTGRTTRLLAEAARLAREGRAVYVVLHDPHLAKRLQRDFNERHVGLGIKFETPCSLGEQIDWRDMRLRGAHPNCVILFDHHVIELKFARTLDELHRFDQAKSPQPPAPSQL